MTYERSNRPWMPQIAPKKHSGAPFMAKLENVVLRKANLLMHIWLRLRAGPWVASLTSVNPLGGL